MPDDTDLPYPLGRVPAPPDVRDRDFPFALALPPVALTELPPSRYWRRGPTRLNQGTLGACVAFAGANWQQSRPLTTAVTNQSAINDYYACKAIDGLPPGTEGTYDRALMKVYQDRGQVGRYLWAQNPDEFKAWILSTGPVLIGVPWFEQMFNPSADHYLTLAGNEVGGHEILVRGYSNYRKAYGIENSWGPNWGDNGLAWLHESDLPRLVWNSWAMPAPQSRSDHDRPSLPTHLPDPRPAG